MKHTSYFGCFISILYNTSILPDFWYTSHIWMKTISTSGCDFDPASFWALDLFQFHDQSPCTLWEEILEAAKSIWKFNKCQLFNSFIPNSWRTHKNFTKKHQKKIRLNPCFPLPLWPARTPFAQRWQKRCSFQLVKPLRSDVTFEQTLKLLAMQRHGSVALYHY